MFKYKTEPIELHEFGTGITIIMVLPDDSAAILINEFETSTYWCYKHKGVLGTDLS